MIDLSSLYATKLTTITLTHPATGKPLNWSDKKEDFGTWTLLSKHTAEYKKLAAAFAKELRDKFGDRKMADLSDAELDDLDLMTLELTAKATTDFNLLIGPEKVKFSKEKALELLSTEELFWLKDQVVLGANNAENFILA